MKGKTYKELKDISLASFFFLLFEKGFGVVKFSQKDSNKNRNVILRGHSAV